MAKVAAERSDTEAPRSSYTTQIQAGVIFLVDLDKGMSVTNDAENVIADLARRGLLVGRRVIYRDTSGRWDELKHDGQRFTGFAPLMTMEEVLKAPAAFVDSMEEVRR